MIITSFSNPKVKLIRKLDQKKYRQETGLFFVEGLRSVGEAVQTGASIDSLVFSPELLVSEFGQGLLDNPVVENVDRIEVSAEIYEKIAHKQGPQGIGALVRQNWRTLDSLAIQPQDLWIALDRVADPGNLGTIMRTADAVGCRGVILVGDSTDPYDPTAVKASMGAIFSLELVQCPWQTFHNWQRQQGVTVVGTSDHASLDYTEASYQRPTILLMGSERHGLTDEMMAACHQMVKIPMAGRGDSLNLAVATAVIVYEIFNQTRDLDIIRS